MGGVFSTSETAMRQGPIWIFIGLVFLLWATVLNKLIQAYRDHRNWAWITNIILASANVFGILFPLAVVNLVKNLKADYRDQFKSSDTKHVFCPDCKSKLSAAESVYCNSCSAKLNSKMDPLFKDFLVRIAMVFIVAASGILAQMFGLFDGGPYKEVAVMNTNYKPSNMRKLDLVELHKKTQSCMKERDTKCVADTFYELSRRHPNQDTYLANYAFRLTHLGYHKQAVEAYKKLDDDMKYDTAAYYGQSLEALGYVEEAKYWYQYSLNIADNSLDIAYKLAKLHIKSNDLKSARQVLNKFISKYPDSKDYFVPLMGLMKEGLQPVRSKHINI
jgi:tetratricopeptide (TPR) repeat protein